MYILASAIARIAIRLSVHAGTRFVNEISHENTHDEYGSHCQPKATTVSSRVETEVEDQMTGSDLRPRTWSNLHNEIANVWIRKSLRMQGCGGCRARRTSVVSAYWWTGFLLSIALIILAVLWYISLSNVLSEPNQREALMPHLILWPSVAVLILLALLTTLCGIFGCKYTCKAAPPEDVVRLANHLEHLGIYSLEEINLEERERMLRELSLTSRQVADCIDVPFPQPTTDQLYDCNASIV